MCVKMSKWWPWNWLGRKDKVVINARTPTLSLTPATPAPAKTAAAKVTSLPSPRHPA